MLPKGDKFGGMRILETSIVRTEPLAISAPLFNSTFTKDVEVSNLTEADGFRFVVDET